VHSTAKMHFGKVSNRFVMSTDRLNNNQSGMKRSLLCGETRYRDENLYMVSWIRPLPGARLGQRRICHWQRRAHDRSNRTTCSRIRMAHLTTRSILLRRPQHSDHVVEETNTRTSSTELHARIYHRGSLQMHMEHCLHWHQLQYNELIGQWFNPPVDKRWRVSRRALEW